MQVCGQISCFVGNGLYFIQVSWKEVKALSDKWFCLKVPGELKENIRAAGDCGGPQAGEPWEGFKSQAAPCCRRR